MVIGHQTFLKDLQDLAARGSLSQSYLFFGPAMTGKRTVAMAFAKFLEKGILEPPHEGEVLQDVRLVNLASIAAGDSDAKDSIGIEAAREMKNFLWQRPAASPRRTLVIDDAEMLTTEAQNALLKLTEEPPASSLVIFITADPDAIVPTILSRVQKIYVGPVAQKEIAVWLEKTCRVLKPKALEAAKRAYGKPGLAWRMLFDEAMRERLALAEKFLKTPAASRRDFVKELIEPDDFKLREFLAAVALQLAWQPDRARMAPLWHKALALQDSAMNFGLNPRLQLEALMS
jgi:DNA polymerase III delta prime subunit